MARILSLSERSLVETQETWKMDADFRIHDLCQQKKISRAQLASKVGISQEKLSNLFAAEGNPTWKQIAAMFAALGEPVDEQVRRLRVLARQRKIGRAKLAEKAGISLKLLSKELLPQRNATVRQVAALFYILGERDSFFLPTSDCSRRS